MNYHHRLFYKVLCQHATQIPLSKVTQSTEQTRRTTTPREQAATGTTDILNKWAPKCVFVQ